MLIMPRIKIILTKKYDNNTVLKIIIEKTEFH